MKKENLVMDIMFFRTSDLDLKIYASKEIKAAYPESVLLVLKNTAKEAEERLHPEAELLEKKLSEVSEKGTKEDLKKSFAEKKSVIVNELCGKLIQELSRVLNFDDALYIMEAFCEAASNQMKPFPMDIVMNMYHSNDDFLVKKSKELVIDNYSMYVHDIIHKHYSSYALKYGEELFQCGCIGLLNAMVNYNNQYKFNTYCTNFILHEIHAQLNFHNNNTTVHYNNIQKKINQAIAEIKNEGMEPSVNKIAIKTELKREVIERELDYIERTRFQYLDVEDGNDRACEYDATPEALFAQKERDESLYQAIQDLPREYQAVVMMKWDNCTNEEIAKAMHTTIGKIKTKYQRGLQMMKRNPCLYETFSDYYSEAKVHMARYSVNAIMPAKDIEAQMDDLMECIGTLNPSRKNVYYVDASDPMGQLAFCL